MTATTRNQTGATESIQAAILDENNLAITGLSDIVVSIRRISDDFFYDFSDDTFKTSGWTTKEQTLSEVDATDAPGEYAYSWDTSAITNETANDTYVIKVEQSPLDAARNVPQYGEIKAGQYVDYIDASINGVPAATDTTLSSAHGSGSWEGTPSAAEMAAAVWNALHDSYEAADSMGYVMKLIRALVTSEMEQDPTANQWKIKDPDTGADWITFDTVNADGNPASVSIYKRTPE
jgi:hypothetical protein